MGGDEISFVNEAFAKNWVAPLGPNVDGFEKDLADFCGSKNAAALVSGTSAIHLALIILGIKHGDDVICQSLTFSGSANPIKYVEANPIFVDSEKDSWNMDPELLEEAVKQRSEVGKKPKAIIFVHLYGMPAKFDKIKEISEKYNIPLIEDAAEALGSKIRIKNSELRIQNGKIEREKEEIQNYKFKILNPALSEAEVSKGKSEEEEGLNDGMNEEFNDGMNDCMNGWRKCGSFTDFGIVSFNGNKIITTSGGGALLSNNEEIIKKARFLATQARDDAPHYEHSEIGYNYRMSNVVAGIGRGQMKVLEKRVEEKRRIFSWYKTLFNGIEGIEFQPEMEGSYSNRWLTAITIDPNKTNGITREDLRLAFLEDNIEARPLWKPMHMQPVFKGCEYYGNGVSEKLFENGLCLPSGTNMSDSDFERIEKVIKKTFSK